MNQFWFDFVILWLCLFLRIKNSFNIFFTTRKKSQISRSSSSIHVIWTRCITSRPFTVNNCPLTYFELGAHIAPHYMHYHHGQTEKFSSLWNSRSPNHHINTHAKFNNLCTVILRTCLHAVLFRLENRTRFVYYAFNHKYDEEKKPSKELWFL